MSALAAEAPPAPSKQSMSVNATGEAVESLTPELVIALCGPIGSPLHETATQIENTLREFNYKTETVRLSNLIRLNAKKVSKTIDTSSKFREIKALIEIGDQLRDQYGSDVLAKLAIAKIGADRKKSYGAFEDVAAEGAKPNDQKIRNQRICHVIDSIKNKAELDLLRLIYGDALFAVGVFSPLELRKINLERPGKLSKDEIGLLIDTDSGEEFAHGQSVRDTFPRCDFFLRVDHAVVGPSEPRAVGQLNERIRRFFDLIFRTAVVTPSAEESAMYAAASAARNSACMSRQVGAAVTSSTGELLAVGWNDVPQSGGGLYGMKPIAARIVQQAQAEDQRCFAQTGRKCRNDEEKSAIADKVVESLISGGVLSSESKETAIKAILADTRVKDLIEFSRAVHAEMHAILGASRVAGDRVVGGSIYVTTYPCHSCARHLVAAGIAEVHYIEPYRKSLATRLHEDALTESTDAQGKVQVRQYDGIAPRRFIEMFEGGSRKQAGVLALKGRIQATPLTQVSLKAIPRLEEVVVAEIETKDLQLHSLLPSEINDDKAPGQDNTAA
ncbi:anti-phage dCTP deaminase [Paucibacter sp. PLA-PC-4]|uniref:anti-phage dCTP deaminase n=1 Tax=Paucibacter sp. PLA-PC-4 TaxID=2993655 RepID=UPI00224A942E|nr:anti-phage dCTP deaminase [Paucibacter sp. PLA-PC-4]MCX2864299.1 anti-phage dCTP deaminase [Paucibacter sp. PLA-PC-4]